MSTLSPTAPTKTMAEAIADLDVRVTAIKAAYSDRAITDCLYEVNRCLGSVGRWLSGENDAPVAWLAKAATQQGRDTYRIQYAADSLVGAEHYILAAEYYAGLRDQSTIGAADPWRYVDGQCQAEPERLRLSEGITFLFNDPTEAYQQ